MHPPFTPYVHLILTDRPNNDFNTLATALDTSLPNTPSPPTPEWSRPPSTLLPSPPPPRTSPSPSPSCTTYTTRRRSPGSGERNYGGLVDACRDTLGSMVADRVVPVPVVHAFELPTYERSVKEVMETLGEIEVEWAVGGLCERRVVHPATEELW
ncbi:hypothetical protein B0J12DRAFT_740645 [Macrophomina phaseolina]|uniref:Uncharacterized protein n=1 Tax=Macrophomina phaseolina TaxID=35725 RepID=A0ABQ8G979_9PEZI|nr:hypothetical protein B0J12DRAFT_740645 [Macrophomina phaseolina]